MVCKLNEHDTGNATKWLQVVEHLVSIVPAGGIILDPFAGIGTTPVAARNTGRKYFGIEKEQEYWRIAVDRLTA